MKKPPCFQTIDGVLLMAFIQICRVWGGCDGPSLQNCVLQLKSFERQVADGLIAYTETELDDICRRFDDIGVCVKWATSTCPTDAPSPSASYKKQLWSGLESSFNYMCKSGKRIYLQHAKCLSSHPAQSSLRLCNRTFYMDRTILKERDFAQAHESRELCIVTNRFLDCLYDAVKKQCGEEAARWEKTVVKKLRQPTMELLHDCKLGCSNLRHGLVYIILSSSAIVIQRLT